jgi:serine/threonine-protein kinase
MRTCGTCGKKFDDSVDQCPDDGSLLKTIITGPHPAMTEAPKLKAERRPPGMVVGSYRLLSVLGEGGMGIVYLAEHVTLKRRVALKILLKQHAHNQAAVQRFFAEARAVNEIAHDHIIEITDFFAESGDDKYYVMELLEGSELADELRNGLLEPQRTLGIAVQVAEALAAVHDGGIIHRDLKPANIFLTERGGQTDYVKLLDFGIAKLSGGIEGASLAKTSTGAILGTPQYMSPEQLDGQAVDHRSDIYSFGLILYEMTTGRRPFPGSSIGELVIKHMTVKPPRPTKIKDLPHAVPQALEDLTLTCLEKDPDRRPQSMHEVAARLRALADNEAVALETYKPLEITQRRRRNNVFAAMGALFLIGVVGAVGFWVANRPDPPPPPPKVVEKPKPKPVKPVPKTEVKVAFGSRPAGAKVYKDDEKTPIGVTPFELSFPIGAADSTFHFRASGFESVTKTVAFNEDAALAVELKEIVKAKPTVKAKSAKIRRDGKSKKKKRLKRNNVVDPFAN